ncbi:MAG: nucleotidyltransferase family protein [Bacteroidales bacterium]
MKALIFAAGLGTRLYPITQDIPKALAKIGDRPLLEIVIHRLIQFGVSDIIINVHHFADKIIEFVNSYNSFGINIQFSNESDQILDTGGGLLKASWFFDSDQPFLVHNVDVLSDIDLYDFYRFHLQSGALASLAVRKRITTRYLLLDKDHVLCGWKNEKTGETKIIHPKDELSNYAFSGIHIIDPRIFSQMVETDRFSIIDLYLRLARTNVISGYDHSTTMWFDLGKPENLKEAEKMISKIDL